MPYESRLGGKRFRHDPARCGIFIHGGTCCAGPWKQNIQPNHFTLTTPTQNPEGVEFSASPAPEQCRTPQPTFQRALKLALRLKSELPELENCPVFACTDLHMDTTCSGSYRVQRVG
jgi:hypothetical protein